MGGEAMGVLPSVRANTAKGRRHLLLGLAHKAALQLGLDDDSRRAAQAAFANGHQSLRDFSDAQLVAWCYELKRRGAKIGIPAPPPKGVQGWGRPSRAQWAEIERLALALGWANGLHDVQLRGFVRRTCAVDDVTFVSDEQASALISGLRRWLAQRSAKAAGGRA